MAGQVAMGGTPHPHIFARKPSTSILIPIPLQRFQTINAFPLQNSPFSHFFIKRALSKFPSSSSTNPSFKRTPNLFTFTSKSLRIHLGLHQGSSDSTITSQDNTKGEFFNPSFNIKCGLEPSSLPWIKTQIQPILVSFLLTKT